MALGGAGDEDGLAKTDGQLLNESATEATDRVAHGDEDDAELALRESMVARGLTPGDTAQLAEEIADAAEGTADIGTA